MAKRSQHHSGEERVTAKSRSMMNLASQDPRSTRVKKEGGSGRPHIGRDQKRSFDYNYHEQFEESFSVASYSKWDERPCLVFSRVENLYWDVQSIGATRWNLLESDTRNSIWFLTRRNPSWWNRAIRCERGNASWQTRANPISILKKWHGFNVSSLETMKQNWNCQWNQDHSRIGWMIRFEKNWKEFQNVTENGEEHIYDLRNVHDCN